MNLERFLERSIDCKQDGNVNQYDFFETVFYTLVNVTRIYEFDKNNDRSRGTIGSKMDFSCRLVKPARITFSRKIVKNRVPRINLNLNVYPTSKESMLNLKSFDSWLSLS